MEETSEELPNFSIGIDLLGPDPTSNKNKAEKNSQVASFANLLIDQLQQILHGQKSVTAWPPRTRIDVELGLRLQTSRKITTRKTVHFQLTFF